MTKYVPESCTQYTLDNIRTIGEKRFWIESYEYTYTYWPCTAVAIDLTL